MLPDSLTGNLREVDIVAQTTISSYNYCLSVECCDHARPADVTWIESMAKKHESLPTTNLVLWSRSGFSQSALLKAKALKIQAISQAEAVKVDWAQTPKDLVGGFVFHVKPTFQPFIDIRLNDGSCRRLEGVDKAVWYNARGEIVGNMEALIAFLYHHPGVQNAFLNHAPMGEGNFYFELPPSEPWFIASEDSNQAAITRIGISVFTEGERAALTAVSAIFDDTATTLAIADLKSDKLEFLTVENKNGDRSVRTHVNKSLRRHKGKAT